MGKFNINEQLNDDDNNDVNDKDNKKVDINNDEEDFLILKRESKSSAKTKPIQFYLNDKMINSLDKLCKQTGKKRNELVVELLNFAINKTKVID